MRFDEGSRHVWSRLTTPHELLPEAKVVFDEVKPKTRHLGSQTTGHELFPGAKVVLVARK